MSVVNAVISDRRNLSAKVQNPSADCSPAYFWMFADDVPLDEMLRQLHDMADKGLRAVLPHPMPRAFRPSSMKTRMSPDYLTPEFFDVCRALMDEAERLGMHYWLYDEGGWPSGGACTLVSRTDPDKFRRMCLTMHDDGSVAPEYICDAKPGFYPDLLNPDVTRTFLCLTHENYFASCGKHFGKTVRYVFQDEAGFHGRNAWRPELEPVFRERKGYDIKPFYPRLYAEPADGEPEDLVRARIDFADVRSQVFTECFGIPIRDWCHAHGLLSSGHFSGEDTPEGNFKYGYGHILRAMRTLDVPGVDTIWRQLFPYGPNGPATHHFPKYASSVARQLGRDISLSESAACYGNGITPQQLKWLTDFQLVRGVNMFVISSLGMSLKEPFVFSLTRPFFGLANPMWKFADIWHADITHSCAIMRQGKVVCDTAVFFDVRSIWAGASIMCNATRLHNDIAKMILDRHCEFDFIDDDAIVAAELTAKNGKPALRVGAMEYTTVVVPSVNRMSAQAKKTLDVFVAAGGSVIDETGIGTLRPLVAAAGDPMCCAALRVTKRVTDDGQAIYMLTNETEMRFAADLAFDEMGRGAPCAKLDTVTGVFEPVECTGRALHRVFEPLSSVILVFGQNAKCENGGEFGDSDVPPDDVATLLLDTGWTIQPLVSYTFSENGVDMNTLGAPPVPASLGAWKTVLGNYFSGHVRYTVDFTVTDDFQSAVLDLGTVGYACEVLLNGKRVVRLAWPPFNANVSGSLKQGTNRLEVIVTSTLADALSDPTLHADWHQRFPECFTGFCYSDGERKFEEESTDSGLLGPVEIRLITRKKPML